MTFRRFNPGCECCGCDYYFDDFNRDNDTDVGDDYTEDAGDWSITSTALLIQSSNARLSIDVAHPDALADGVVGFVVYCFSDGDQPRFIFDYDDSDNYFFVQLTVGSSGTLGIYKRESGTETLLQGVSVNAPSGQFLTLFVYWGRACPGSDNYIVAYMPDDIYNEEVAIVRVQNDCSVTVATSFDGKYLGTGSVTTAIYFDQLTMWKHYSATNTSCPCFGSSCSDAIDDFSVAPSTSSQSDLVIEWETGCSQWVIDNFGYSWCSQPLEFNFSDQGTCSWPSNFNSGTGLDQLPFYPERENETFTYWQWGKGTGSVLCPGEPFVSYYMQVFLACFGSSGWGLMVSIHLFGSTPNAYNINGSGNTIFTSIDLQTDASGNFVGDAVVPIYEGGSGDLLCTLTLTFGP